MAVIVFAVAGRNATDDDGDNPLRVTAPVERRTIADEVVTRGVVAYSPHGSISAAVGGRVTSVSVASGDVIKAGQAVLAVDGRVRVAVGGKTPFWRQLEPGVNGPDVAQLQQILADAGFESADTTGTFGAGTKRALKQWQTAHGYAVSDGVLYVDDMLANSWPQRVGSVDVDVGQVLMPGADIVTLTDLQPVVTVELLPSDRLRVESGDPAVIDVSATGVTADGKLSAVSDAPLTTDDESLVYPGEVAVAKEFDASEGAQVRVTIVVDEVEDALVVPVAAVISDSEGAPAVRIVNADGSVNITAVELGLSQGAYVEVRSGLEGSETVVVAEEDE